MQHLEMFDGMFYFFYFLINVFFVNKPFAIINPHRFCPFAQMESISGLVGDELFPTIQPLHHR